MGLIPISKLISYSEAKNRLAYYREWKISFWIYLKLLWSLTAFQMSRWFKMYEILINWKQISVSLKGAQIGFRSTLENCFEACMKHE